MDWKYPDKKPRASSDHDLDFDMDDDEDDEDDEFYDDEEMGYTSSGTLTSLSKFYLKKTFLDLDEN